MEVTFVIDDFGPEALALQAAAQGLAPEESEHLFGAIVFAHPGQPTIAVRDDLLNMARPLCKAVPARLRQGLPADLSMKAWPGLFSFTPQPGNTVRITGSTGDDATYPQQELMDGLQACGQRLAACMGALADVAPQYGVAGRALAEDLGSA